MQSLQTFIEVIEKGRNIHISILDVSGILSAPDMKIELKNVIHSKPFCDIAKSTGKGMRACLLSKRFANERAMKSKASFCGCCIYGLCEAAYPLIIGETVCAIVYVGHAVTDRKKTEERIVRTCGYTGVDANMLLSELSDCEQIESESELICIAQIVSDYIKMLYQTTPKETSNGHWLVRALVRHADEKYTSSPTLKELSVLYHKNEKYMGRLFLAEVGMSFNKYCLLLRLKKAAGMLEHGDQTVIDIALECGFNNISYFNRAFKSHYGTSPTEYRKEAALSIKRAFLE